MAPTRRQTLALANALAAGALLPGCLGSFSMEKPNPKGGLMTETPEKTVTGTENPNPASTDEKAIRTLARGNTAFGLDLLASLAGDSPGENQFFSPYSVSVALAMTYAGARGETRTEMHDTLLFPLDGDSLHAAFGKTDDEIESTAERSTADSDEGTPFQLTTANAVWGQDGYPWRDEFLDTLLTYYGAGLHICDFEHDADGARDVINNWAAERTADKITDLLPEGSLDAMTRLVLTDAIYFKATWDETFSEKRTERKPFTTLDGTEVMVPMMSQSSSFPYATVDGHQLIELPYVGGEVGMVVVLPKEDTFEEFTDSLDADGLTTMVDELEPEHGSISLPKFGVESSFELGTTLASLGMERAFSSNADFGGMANLEKTGEDLRIGDVFHESYIDVGEKGTEAAAATAVKVVATGAPANPFEMTIDRPFLFLIRHKPTDTTLFLGRVVSP
ncbi:serpin family protein [Haladaptatus sp. AB618]|uniref:serpin family protein n=1 Tax=Haladaptatus sp. AB618 TaxID=2934173 RepID=UPI00209C5CC8|nr:serpin family protein [Haladaptatus sp. AB618]MCO8256082.1 serpin family protein [Haladaptatus sp. AB618]